MTTELARTFIDDLDQLPEAIPGAASLDPGRLSWLHGVNAGGAKTPGVFYAKDTAFTDAPAAPWSLDERYSEQSEIGYSAPELRLAFIGERSQWFIPGAAQGDPPEWIIGYREGAKKLTEYLVVIDGLADVMVLSVSGKYKAGPFADILRTYRQGLLTQAMRRVKRTLPLWAFWLPIANQRDGNGKTKYVTASGADGKEYGSVVTPPALFLPKEPMSLARTVAEIQAGADLWQEYQEWFKAKRLPRDTVEAQGYVVSETKVLPSPRNMPVTIEQEPDALEWDKPADMSSAEYRFFVRHEHIIGGRDWTAVQHYLKSRAPKPTTPEGWIAAAEMVRDAPRHGAVEETDLPPF